jgi:hypothetical protein
MGNFKCAVCGAITWCHQGPDTLEKQIDELKEKMGVPTNKETRTGTDTQVGKTNNSEESSDSLRIQQLRKLKRNHRSRKKT